MEGLRVTLSRSATGKRTRFSVPACGKRSFPGRAPLGGGVGPTGRRPGAGAGLGPAAEQLAAEEEAAALIGLPLPGT